ncbi:hypothetical protein LTR35_009592 [Friedmanniomyces endolithicus]|uniref:Uncharacterized protein n=1 Tax=Friedmanniomyces endolithicus TaxID=329885 RepID=A0AAN6FP46_9PEZI|nr:hypothetical protein LTR35_009592 [Friedmanniomyces endolithicus]KAK0301201.1 hypothetical protein LTS00_000350 [Friedmanniomyces endolithicus]KAK0321207.1 hypothetical protein LTR82_007659 [Friedmanniomyces endolithicus]KAK0983918.1 hypothetical protein LTR54_014210 [Friedmanniomyces endolithicus]
MVVFKSIRPLSGICVTCARKQFTTRPFATSRLFQFDDIRSSSSLPRIATPSFWASLVPKPWRRKAANDSDGADAIETTSTAPAKKSRPWSPYTTILILALLVGSNAIQLISIRNDTLAFSRKTEAKLSLLREVLQKVKRGEIDDAEVKRALGTGIAEVEREWEEVVKEIEETDVLLEAEKRKKAIKAKKLAEKAAKERESASPVAEVEGDGAASTTSGREGIVRELALRDFLRGLSLTKLSTIYAIIHERSYKSSASVVLEAEVSSAIGIRSAFTADCINTFSMTLSSRILKTKRLQSNDDRRASAAFKTSPWLSEA